MTDFISALNIDLNIGNKTINKNAAEEIQIHRYKNVEAALFDAINKITDLLKETNDVEMIGKYRQILRDLESNVIIINQDAYNSYIEKINT